jgi:glycosyltransferase involved in cell wall biosynthesis
MTSPEARLSPAHRLWQALPAGPRRLALAKVTALLAPKPDRVPPQAMGGLAVAGEIARASGLGESARLMIAALRGMGVPTTPIDLGDAVSGPGAVTVPPANMPLVLHANSPVLPLTLLRAPRALARHRRVIGYWAWELPTLPASWRAGLPFVHEIWVLSQFTADAIATLRPGVPLRVVPPPVALAPPHPSARTRAAFGLPEHALITLVSFSLASSFARKNPLAAIAAHRAAFGDRPDRVLLLKVGNSDGHGADLALLRDACAGFGNIRLETRMFNDADRHALTACADIVLSLHRSEGLGLVPAEAMLLGVPVIATGWSATTEFMDETSACLVAHRLVAAIDPRGVFEAPGAHWAEADIEDAAHHLRRLADDPALRRSIGAAGRRMATERLGDAQLRAAVQSLGLDVA